MTTETPVVPTQRPRRTWRQWSKLARVRIGCVLMLIVAISVFSLWWPRRGIVSVAWMGGGVHDPEFYDQVRNACRNLPAPIGSLVRKWNRPHTSWLSIDDRIENVDLSKVRSQLIDSGVLRRFPRLGYLVLHARHVSPGLERLTGVDSVHGVWVTGLQPTSDLGELRHLPSLEDLDIETCPTSGGGFEHLSRLPKLKRILFDRSPTTAAIRGVGQCPGMEELYLQSGFADEDDIQFLHETMSLREFRMAGKNPVGATGLKHIAQIPSLEMLVLNPTSATDEELQVLASLTKLKSFYVRGPNLTRAGIDRLKEAMPNCKIDGP